MCSAKQLDANRLNAQQSTGPKSQDGKHRSSQNSLKHGLTSPSLLPTESPESHNEFCSQIIQDLNPQTLLEQMLANRIANLLWRLRRIPGAESHLFTLLDNNENQPNPHHLAQSFLAHDDKSNPFNRLQRYESHLHRSLTTTLKELRTLQKRHENEAATDNGPLTADNFDKLQNEPIPPRISPPPSPHDPIKLAAWKTTGTLLE
jgi:hypothetical protein